ncbi:hypothetical protein WR25_08821 [Diploscapter pachys]|uniref:Uncharacterized protein n=1 Tax=Diploscapter pachys TaxID=2018661 RepID=A0A2A2M3R1_9BILA|nr:hypothetical protein WR25_08821 [Diploscapter pachys]
MIAASPLSAAASMSAAVVQSSRTVSVASTVGAASSGARARKKSVSKMRMPGWSGSQRANGTSASRSSVRPAACNMSANASPA